MAIHHSFRSLKSHIQVPIALLPRSVQVRHASLNSAIGRGIRKTQTIGDRSPRNWENDRQPSWRRDGENRNTQTRGDRSPRKWENDRQPSWRRDGENRNTQTRGDRSPRNWENDRQPSWPRDEENRRRRAPDYKKFDRSNTDEGFDEDEFIKTGKLRTRSAPSRGRLDSSRSYNPASTIEHTDSYEGLASKPKRRASKEPHHRYSDEAPERVKANVSVPESIPYTTPASEFMYGRSSIEAALRCGRRQMYKLYLYQAEGEDLSPSKIVLRKLALTKNVPVKMAFAGWDRLFDKLSAGRPHNGCIMEVSPLPKIPVKSLGPGSSENDYFCVELGAQSREEALVNGTNNRITINHSQSQRRNPVVLMLDGVVDTGNLGAMVRSAYYLGADAIVFAGRNSAPMSPLTVKTSVGAAENMTMLQVSNEGDFIKRSKANGWRFYAADAIPSDSAATTDNPDLAQAVELVTNAPAVIMLGNEGEGLSKHIRSHADAIVSIPGSRIGGLLGVEADPARIDSLNVSVAAALLMEKFLRIPLTVADVPRKRP
ncbi:hypothetical protein FE257_002916 [Aspergillus nanangensis]|uniref:rRNA methyltransferase 1, mitochondrial n=1 Tax=Aspergillus nanangensis TaxID=2582783 RepID=A0AAD4CT43_ASPNN|nr:hypothetical protein FE257_002916 [Aspergillus nanangensis]